MAQVALEEARETGAAAQREAAEGESRALELESSLAKHKAVYVVSTPVQGALWGASTFLLACRASMRRPALESTGQCVS